MPTETALTISINTTRGVISGMVATLVTHPLDLLKIRSQISPTHYGSIKKALIIYRNEGWRTFYCGLNAGLWRQLTNTATRLMVYDVLHDRYMKTHLEEPPVSAQIVIGLISSMAGGVVGNPSEMVLVRRMAEGCHFLTSTGQHRCDGAPRKTCQSFFKIIREEGVLSGLWRGCTLTLLRSAMVSTIHIGIYDAFKLQEFLARNNVAKDEHSLGLYTLVLTHFVSALLTHPVDIVKSHYQLSKKREDTPMSITSHILRSKGAFGLMKGFTPYFVRMTSHAIIKFYVLERI